jgi:hypothetical protein
MTKPQGTWKYHRGRRNGADKADNRADREIDVAADDDEQHAKRHNRHIAVLQDQVRDVDGASSTPPVMNSKKPMMTSKENNNP